MDKKIEIITGIIILVLLALTPLFNIVEVSNILRGDVAKFAATATPIYIKLIKDTGFAAIILLSILAALRAGRIKRLAILMLPAMSIFFILFILSYSTDHMRAIAGLRWATPVILAIALIGNVDDSLMAKIAKTVSIIFLIHVTLQIYEHLITSMLMDTYSRVPRHLRPVGQYLLFKTLGNNMFGLRSPGIFLLPNTAGFFTIASGFFSYFYLKRSWFRVSILLLIPVSILLCGSATAILALMVVICCILIKRNKVNSAPAVFSISFTALIIMMLPKFTGRADIFRSICTRIGIFISSLQHSEIISSKFGYGTNTFVLMMEKSGQKLHSAILDSALTGILVNTGLIGLLVFTAAYLYWVKMALRSKRQDTIIFTIIYTFLFLTNSVFEAFPLNILFAAGLAYFLPVISKKSGSMQYG